MSGNDIALAVFDVFSKLRKGKPVQRSNGKQEWTVLASVVVIEENEHNKYDKHNKVKYIPITLATGVKTIPEKARLYSAGTIVHDLHAEILALRLFNLYLLEEAKGSAGERITERSASGLRKMKDGVRLALLITEPPCGDASMTNVRNKLEDATEWEGEKSIEERSIVENRDQHEYQLQEPEDQFKDQYEVDQDPPLKKHKLNLSDALHRGRHLINQVGIVRTKPGRKDSPISLSKSCSDKLCLKQLTGITNAITSQFYEDIFLDYIVVPHKKYHLKDFSRCFHERFTKKLHQSHPFQTLTFDQRFEFSQDSGKVASPLSMLHIPSLEITQVLSNGVRDGTFRKNKPALEQGQGVACNQALVRKAVSLEHHLISKMKHYKTYEEMKTANLERQALKRKGREVLTGGRKWVATTKDDFQIA